MSLSGKSAVITGAGSGVGRATALRFGADGAKVVCADIRDDWATATADRIRAAGGTAVALRTDVTAESDVEAAIQTAADTFGRLDIMVNNVGITRQTGMRLEDHDDTDFQILVDVNFRGVYYGCKHAVLRFKAQGGGGVIVNTGSVAGLVGWGGTLYGATKAAVNQITRGVAVECAADGIRVNAICPAAMPLTNFGVPEGEAPNRRLPDEELKWIADMHPLGRYITAEDCAHAIAFLASDEAANITGVLLPVDGGFVAR
ncbi:MAG: SDR family oxidoreductase [Streptomycetaceae bacterium]|nr:SDR family oxidoreductase [Streptomycetaceae bacterium]